MKEEKKQLFRAFGFHSFTAPNIRISLIYFQLNANLYPLSRMFP
jgi:hypothetical protein